MDAITVRDYLAAHAPAEPQAWFEPSSDFVKPQSGQSATYAHFQTEKDKWQKENIKQKYVQWPYAWADAVLAARKA